MVKTASIVAPILVTVGGAMAVSRALAAGILLVIFAAGMYYAFGYGVFAMFLIAFVGAARLFVRCGKTGPCPRRICRSLQPQQAIKRYRARAVDYNHQQQESPHNPLIHQSDRVIE